MKVFIILATLALAHGAKLERTYLPPSHARASGGSGNFLQTPISGPHSQNGAGFTQTGFLQNGRAQVEAGFSQTGATFSQNGNEISRNGAGFSQDGNGFTQSGFEPQPAYNNGFNNLGFEARPERAQAALERNAAILRQDSSNDGESFAYAFETENGIYAEESGVATNGVEAQGGYSYTGDDGQVYSVRYTADQNGFVPQGDHLPTAPPVPKEILKALEQNARDEAAGIFDDGSYNEGKYAASNIYNGQQNYQQNFNNDDTVVTNAAFARNYPSDADTPRTANVPTSGSSNFGVEKAYLPPFGTAQTDIPRAPTGLSPRGPTDFATRGPTSPAFGASSLRGSTGAFAPRGTGPAFGARATSGSFAGSTAGVQKAYLPPFASRSGNGFGRRQQNFDSNNGYRY